jgi:cobalt-precorrin-7 (C5)-methyltransferase
LAKLNIIGTGPGSPDYVTPAAKKTVQNAALIIGAQRSLNLFKEDVHGEVTVLTAKNLKECLKQATENVKNGKEVAFLSTGDPGFSGLLHTVLESGLVKAEEINVVPGVSAIQACAAKLAISWDKTCLFTFHEGNVTPEDKNHLLSCIKNGKNVILLPDARAFPPKEIANFLLNAKIPKETPAYVCENLTLPEEKVFPGSLAEVSKLDFGALSVMVIKANH